MSGAGITRVDVGEHEIPLSRPYTIATASYDRVTNFVVEIRAGDHVGLGVASPDPDVTGESVEDTRTALMGEGLTWLKGCEAGRVAELCPALQDRMPGAPAARAAVDMALHDLAARQAGVPLVSFLGGEIRGMTTSVTIGIEDVADTVSEACEHVAAGFQMLKIKLGHDLDGDVERLHRVREACGPSVGLRVDANQGYDAAETVAFARRTTDLGIELIEQPMRAASREAGSLEPMADLPEEIRRRIAADESLLGEDDAHRLSGPPPVCGIYNIKLMKCGGIWTGLRMAAVAGRAGIELMWGCMDESVIGISAALHASLASPATRYLDLDGSFDLARDPATGGFELRDGDLWPLDRPGLGVELV